jgi:hypothetical protein
VHNQFVNSTTQATSVTNDVELKRKGIPVGEDVWASLKIRAIQKGLTLTQALEEAICAYTAAN